MAVVIGTGQIVYPEWWGAKGDGSTDDATAINACIQSAPAGGIIKFTCGRTYIIGSAITLKSDITLEGYGSCVKLATSKNIDMFSGSAISDFSILGLEINGRRSSTNDYGYDVIDISNSSGNVENITIKDCEIHHFGSTAIKIGTDCTDPATDHGNIVKNVNIESNYIHDGCTNNGSIDVIHITGSVDKGKVNNIKIRGNTIKLIDDIDLYGISGYTYSNTYASATSWTVTHNLNISTSSGIHMLILDGSGEVVVPKTIVYNSVNQATVNFYTATAGTAYCSKGAGAGIWVGFGDENIVVSDNIIIGSGPNGDGICIKNGTYAENINVCNNIILDSLHWAIHIGGKNISITGNTIKNTRLGGIAVCIGPPPDSANNGYRSGTSYNVSVTGNTLEHTRTSGIWVRNTIGCSITGNTVRDATDGSDQGGINVEPPDTTTTYGDEEYCSNFTITGNTLIAGDGWGMRTGICISELQNSVISGNLIVGDDVGNSFYLNDNYYTTTEVGNKYNLIQGNTISSNIRGIYNSTVNNTGNIIINNIIMDTTYKYNANLATYNTVSGNHEISAGTVG